MQWFQALRRSGEPEEARFLDPGRRSPAVTVRLSRAWSARNSARAGASFGSDMSDRSAVSALDREALGTSRQAESHLWHQMTNEREWARAPTPFVTRAQGSFFWDVAGRKIIDGNSGLQNVHIGHGREEMASV